MLLFVLLLALQGHSASVDGASLIPSSRHQNLQFMSSQLRPTMAMQCAYHSSGCGRQDALNIYSDHLQEAHSRSIMQVQPMEAIFSP